MQLMGKCVNKWERIGNLWDSGKIKENINSKKYGFVNKILIYKNNFKRNQMLVQGPI